MTSTRYNWQFIRAGTLKLDGGGMFGVVPKTLWSKVTASDELNRIPLAHNCILLKRIDSAGRTHSILIETGSGDKFDPKLASIYGLEGDDIATALFRARTRPADVEHVVVSHLHFDHAGGLTRRGKESESVELSFPKAQIHCQQREWDDAITNTAVMTRTYLKENLNPIKEQLKLVDSPAPFKPGHIPAKGENPASPLQDRLSEILPGIFVFKVPGHTWGQQAILFKDEMDQTVVFTPDVMPTVNHVGQAYNMGYDVEPYISGHSRRWYLEEAMRGNWLLVLDHEPGNPLQRVKADGKGWYSLVEESVKIERLGH